MEIVSTAQWTERGKSGAEIEGKAHGAAVTVLLEHMPPGRGPRLHSHPYGEAWVVVEGRVAFSDGQRRREASAGDVVYVGPGEPHKFTVTGDEPVKMVCIHQSPEFITDWLEAPPAT